MAAAWGTEKIEFGDVTEAVTKSSDHDFSNAVSMVVTLTAKRLSDPNPPLSDLHPPLGVQVGWWLFDSIDGGSAWSVEDTDGEYRGWLGFHNPKARDSPRLSSTRRFVVPVAPRLSIGLQPQRLGGEGETDLQDFALEGVVAMIFWRGIG
jgi:hypothetical protein